MMAERPPLERLREQPNTLAGAMASQAVKHETMAGKQIETLIDGLPHNPLIIADATLVRLTYTPSDISPADGFARVNEEFNTVLETWPKDTWEIPFGAAAVAHDALVQALIKAQQKRFSDSKQVDDAKRSSQRYRPLQGRAA